MKDAPPGYRLSFDRHRRKWKWIEEATGRESKQRFENRGACCHDAYEQMRAARDQNTTGDVKPPQPL